MGGPVTQYFQKKEIILGVDEDYHRNTPKNCGGFKLGSNYGPTVYMTNHAEETEGVSQLIWTYDGYMLESGASNIFFLLKEGSKKFLVTHPADGMVLEGVTRDSILKLAKEIDSSVETMERPINIKEFIERFKANQIEEVFMSGTAAIIT